MLFLILSTLGAPEEDRALIERLKQRDPEAMGELYNRFGRIALAIIVRIVRDRATAEDLLQETLLKVWNRVAGFDGERGTLGPWVLTIARNRAIDYLRSTDARHNQAACDLERLERPYLFVDLEAQYEREAVFLGSIHQFGRLLLQSLARYRSITSRKHNPSCR